MLASIAYILLVGMLAGWLCKKVYLPGLLGMLMTGIVLGPHVLNLIDENILLISADLRKIALIIILIRAGLTLNIDDLKKVGRPAIMMCFVPACFEMLGMVILAPMPLGISVLDAAIMGAVIAAVSSAVVVPKMIRLIEEGYGRKHGIPELILAGASVDDVFVIVMFTTFTSLAQGDTISVMSFVDIPLSIISGIIAGWLIGGVLALFFRQFHMRDTIKVAIILSVAFLLVTFEDQAMMIPFASLIAVMTLGLVLKKQREAVAVRLSSKFNKLWVVAEVMLFVLVGAIVDINYALNAGIAAIILIFGVLLCRMAGVYVCMIKTKLTSKERLFCMLAYTPKATVQAAMGGVPLAMGLACGNIVLTMAVIAIIITAPFGAFMIDRSYPRLLKKD